MHGNLVLLLIFSILLQASPSRCCLQHERAALLQLKPHLVSVLSRSGPTTFIWSPQELGSWGDERNCCSWHGVSCNGPMQHVTALSLDQLYEYPCRYNIPSTAFCALNVSLFQPFQELTSLNLSNNYFGGLFGHKGLVKLKQLQVLDLSSNNINMNVNEFFKALPNWKELQVLDLSWNLLNGSLSEQGFLCGMQNLQELHLRENSISGNLPRCIGGNLTSLRILDISFNYLSGDIAPIFQNLHSIESLSISNNSFFGEFSLNSLLNHSNLVVLVLSNNHLHVKLEDPLHYSNFQPQTLGLSNCNLNMISRSFMQFLSQMRNLQVLDISHNGLVGSFPTWLLLNNSNLKAIMTSNNSFGGVLRFPKDGNGSLINVLDISVNNFNGSFPENIGTMFPSLQYLIAPRNNFQGEIPISLGNMTTLKLIDLSNNHFSGEVPRRLLTHCDDLYYLRLSNNSLQGDIIPGHLNLTSLKVFYLDGNNFTGTITNGVFERNYHLESVDISNNEVTGDIPSWIGNFSYLTILSLSHNYLKGQIPSEICNLQSIKCLDFYNNGLTGTIPSCYNHSRLLGLQLHNNFLSGSIPHGLTRSPSLFTLDLSGNRLSGRVPLWIGNLLRLNILLLGHNSLGGELPQTLCRLEQINIMDLSSNDISGGIPACLANMSFGAIPNFEDVNVSIGKVSPKILESWVIPGGAQGGWYQEEVALLTKSRYYDYKGYILNIMSMLDLSGNRLTGEIPKEIGQLGKLQALNLSCNELSGSIPSSFARLLSIESLDLSYNNFSGWIPSQLAQITALEIFNVSYNNLSGMVPKTGQFASFDESNYMGNPLLCGFIGKSCMDTSKNTSPDREDDGPTSTSGFDWEVFLWSFGMSCITLFLAINVILSINPQWRRAWFLFIDSHVHCGYISNILSYN